jgi:hypothetical protein
MQNPDVFLAKDAKGAKRNRAVFGTLLHAECHPKSPYHEHGREVFAER